MTVPPCSARAGLPSNGPRGEWAGRVPPARAGAHGGGAAVLRGHPLPYGVPVQIDPRDAAAAAAAAAASDDVDDRGEHYGILRKPRGATEARRRTSQVGAHVRYEHTVVARNTSPAQYPPRGGGGRQPPELLHGGGRTSKHRLRCGDVLFGNGPLWHGEPQQVAAQLEPPGAAHSTRRARAMHRRQEDLLASALPVAREHAPDPTPGRPRHRRPSSLRRLRRRRSRRCGRRCGRS